MNTEFLLYFSQIIPIHLYNEAFWTPRAINSNKLKQKHP